MLPHANLFHSTETQLVQYDPSPQLPALRKGAMSLSPYIFVARSGVRRWNSGGYSGGEDTKNDGAGAPMQRQGIELDYADTTEAQQRLGVLNTGVSFGDGFG